MKSTLDAPRFASDKLQELGALTLPEKIILAVFTLLLFVGGHSGDDFSARR